MERFVSDSIVADPMLPAAQPGPRATAAALEQACRLSRYVRHLTAARPELAQTLDASRPFDAAAMRAFIAAAAPADERALARTLRDLRQRVMLRVIVRDLAGWADLAEVVATMTDLADVALDEASGRIEAWLGAQYGMPSGADGAPQRLMVVGMGKLGGRSTSPPTSIPYSSMRRKARRRARERSATPSSSPGWRAS